MPRPEGNWSGDSRALAQHYRETKIVSRVEVFELLLRWFSKEREAIAAEDYEGDA